MKRLIIYTLDGAVFEANKNELTYQDGYISFTGELIVGGQKYGPGGIRYGKFSIPFSNLSFVYEPLTS